MKALSRAVLLVLPLVLLSGPALAGTLKLEIRNGRVTLEARDVPVRDILAEWARLGQTRIENRERVGGAPVTLTLKDVPEREALDVLLRAVSGYIAAPRSTPVADASMYDVIYVLAAARPASPQGTGSAQTQSQQQLFRGGRGQTVPPGMVMQPNDPADEGADSPMPAVMRPGFVMDQQVPYPGAPGLSQIQIQMSPGMLMPATPAGQGSQSLPFTGSPGMPTAAPGAVAPGMPTGGTTVPGVTPPSTPGTVAKPIKPPGQPQGT